MANIEGKRYRDAHELVDEQDEPVSLREAAELAKETATANFDESIDLDLRLGVDPQHADQMVRGSITLPNGTGREVTVLVLASEGKQEEAEEAGADYVGLDEYIERIQEENWLDFDVAIATPDVMGQVGQLGRILGPRGLMPNPKSGTVTMDLAETIEEIKAGKIEFRVDRSGNLHTAIGKASFSPKELYENARALLREVVRLRPASASGLYLRSMTMSATMGPPVRIDRSSVLSEVR
ncbi:MAG: 50S ribosomal protein L1 [Bacteroidetes bacterium SW_8_64_56]|jgi:large subunit ribosomal protein L1|nr:MAG: 50S ribosomal protein L1 [Bacteroidetes bacterium QH_6_64_77]PSQ74842.1 MAG: 50S ribosomal protein L1 [Bacteroidetes bacterium QH_7_64_110]PSQ94153.1 MAG: 50S ribosomal protein L1 [Bacteroidetes bacterium SW_7_64_58]PSR00800.1 MAG: 50S ribosomal protein L1 [Bacteroidetes bacterium SW_8_64_56]